jgi:hypothetical protein
VDVSLCLPVCDRLRALSFLCVSHVFGERAFGGRYVRVRNDDRLSLSTDEKRYSNFCRDIVSWAVNNFNRITARY